MKMRKIYRVTTEGLGIVNCDNFQQAIQALEEYYRMEGCWTTAESDEFYQEIIDDEREKELEETGYAEFYDGDNIEIIYKPYNWELF